MQDKLKEIFERQLRAQQGYKNDPSYPKNLSEKDREDSFIHTILLMIKETSEVLDEVNFKHHVSCRKEINREKLLEELIDVFKYFINLCIIFEYDYNDIYNMFYYKTKIVDDRILRE